MGMDVGGGGKTVKSEINVTPLVDVVLVLLIIFMVITPMLQKGKMVQLPEAQHVASRETPRGQEPVEPIVIAVKDDGSFWLDKDEVSLAELPAALEAEHRADPARHVLVKADKAAEYGKVRRLLKSIEDAGIQGASLAAAKLQEEGEGGENPEGGE